MEVVRLEALVSVKLDVCAMCTYMELPGLEGLVMLRDY